MHTHANPHTHTHTQTRGITEEIYQTHITRWKTEAFKLGSTPENWDMWMQHQADHDHHTPVVWHLEQLKEIGFTNIDVLWKNIMWVIVYAQKKYDLDQISYALESLNY